MCYGKGGQPPTPYHFPIQFMPAMQGDDNISICATEIQEMRFQPGTSFSGTVHVMSS